MSSSPHKIHFIHANEYARETGVLLTACGREVPADRVTNMRPPAGLIAERQERYCRTCFGHP